MGKKLLFALLVLGAILFAGFRAFRAPTAAVAPEDDVLATDPKPKAVPEVPVAGAPGHAPGTLPGAREGSSPGPAAQTMPEGAPGLGGATSGEGLEIELPGVGVDGPKTPPPRYAEQQGAEGSSAPQPQAPPDSPPMPDDFPAQGLEGMPPPPPPAPPQFDGESDPFDAPPPSADDPNNGFAPEDVY